MSSLASFDALFHARPRPLLAALCSQARPPLAPDPALPALKTFVEVSGGSEWRDPWFCRIDFNPVGAGGLQ